MDQQIISCRQLENERLERFGWEGRNNKLKKEESVQ
jgi:hypothetical protein